MNASRIVTAAIPSLLTRNTLATSGAPPRKAAPQVDGETAAPFDRGMAAAPISADKERTAHYQLLGDRHPVPHDSPAVSRKITVNNVPR